MKIVDSIWNTERRLLITRLQGRVHSEDVHCWETSLKRELDRIENNTTFKMILDSYGYEPSSIDAHKEMRTIIPLTLAAYGFQTALLDLYDPIDLPVQSTRGITCIACAHINHEEFKMGWYDQEIGRANERFFTDFKKAEMWITAIG
jgi:hypothetical protein